MEFVILQSFTNYIEAHILMGRMEEEGIRCWLKDENTVTINPIWTNAVGGIKLMVAKEQLERALALQQQYVQEKRMVFYCPKCGSNDIEFISSPRKALNWFSALIGAIGFDKEWHCFNCNADFKEPVEKNSSD